MKRLFGYIRLMRPINCLMMGFAVVVGAVLADANIIFKFYSLNLVYGFFTGFLLTAASMVINDYYDREIDAINEPSRPIPSGLIKPKEALAFAVLLTVMGLTAAGLNSIKATFNCFIIAVIFWLISVSYVTFGKKTGFPGNLLVSACVSAPFLYGSLAVTNTVRSNIWIFVAMVFFSNTGREITKGIADVEGDKARDVKTIAVIYGERRAAIAAVMFFLFAVALTPIPPLLNLVSVLFIPIVAITDGGLIASSMMLLKNPTRDNAKKVKNQSLGWFLVGLIAFLAGSMG
ncbi:MAG: geranylgeranylglycerol-phosphate geranylgeranyltransferase [Candidatus Bathyarchaeota archaeon]|nr:geranylgeranylglycerol-phosphate geranylgeranyltransferase [Candidatus Bathyarchaeota archaeon]MDW8039981.1 geranylgeranylglycerol-phosphate geranylgeranyltransferase [Nitrososphaerota archaeon]